MSSTDNVIILSSNPQGKFLEGIVSGTPKPGTCMQVKAATEPVDGRLTYEVYNAAADGNQRPIIVLLEDEIQGVLPTVAATTGSRRRFYQPAPGDLLNMLLQDVVGTGDSHAIGELLIVDDGTGKLIATTGTPESEPFQLEETLAAITADTLATCRYTGH